MINLKKGNDVTAATADGAVKNTSKKEIIPSIPGVPKANLEVIAIVMFNAGIRRFTALNIISHLKEAGILKKDSKAYVNFIWTKFQVKENGLATEYRYSELFLLKLLFLLLPTLLMLLPKISMSFVIITILMLAGLTMLPILPIKTILPNKIL